MENLNTAEMRTLIILLKNEEKAHGLNDIEKNLVKKLERNYKELSEQLQEKAK